MKKLGLFVAALALGLPAMADPAPSPPTAGKAVKRDNHIVCEMVEQTGTVFRERVCRSAGRSASDAKTPTSELEDIRAQAERDAVRNVPNALRPKSPQ